MDVEHLIVQASGKGTRLGHLTKNKPKALTSVYGLPLLYHLYYAFPNATFYIVGNYKFDILEKYLQLHPPKFKYFLIRSDGTGSCEGLQNARKRVLEEGGAGFGIVWCDLYFPERIVLPDKRSNFIGLTKEFECRWSFVNGRPEEVKGDDAGIMGFFYFADGAKLPEIPENGEFVKFLRDSGVELEPFYVSKVKEVGTMENFLKIRESHTNSRFFNEVIIEGDKVVKKLRDPHFKHLLDDEKEWYRFVSSKGYACIPKIYGFEPLTMEKINGCHPYESDKLNLGRMDVTGRIMDALKKLHELGESPYDEGEINEVYVNKTKQRIDRISKIIPQSDAESYIINDKKIPNLLHPKHTDRIDRIVGRIRSRRNFTVIHGDPTFSNVLIEYSGKVVFIDPRGYFGKGKIFGDPLYDFAKLYYSVVGNYDQFNQRKFQVHMSEDDVKVDIQSNGFEEAGSVFSKALGEQTSRDIKILHALIWLSLAGYVMDDVDSIFGAYFHGLELFDEAFENE